VPRGLPFQTVLACTLLTVVLLLSYGSPATAALTLSRTVWDFGSLEQGETKTQKIIITNSGSEPLKIEKAELPEGCSVIPSLYNAEIQPEKQLEAQFTFDSEGSLGRIQQYAYIFPSGSDEKIVSLTITGEVLEKSQPRLRVNPQTWDFRTITTGDPRKQIFTCENVGTAELKIEKIQIYDTKFKVDRNITKQTLAPGEKVDFVVGVTGSYAGRYDTDFYVKSNSVGSSFTKVSIKGYGVSKPSGLVISSSLSSVTNNTFSTFEVTRTDKEGKPEKISVERNSTKRFPPKPGPRTPPTLLSDYTLTIKLIRPLPAPKPAEKSITPAVKPEEKPAEEQPSGVTTAPPELLPPVKPEKAEPPKKPEGEEQPAPKPEAEKPSEEKTPPQKEPSPTGPEKAKPAAKPEQVKEETTEKPKEGKEPAPPATQEKKESEKPAPKPSSEAGESKSSGEKPPPPPTEPSKSPGSEEPPKDPAKTAPGGAT